TEDVGDPMLAQHLTSIVTLQRLAIANGYGWRRFLQSVDKVVPRVGDTMVLPINMDPDGDDA
ncbi:MAG: P63C domain-containing protein, partial [Acidimicrobiales bacterium]